MFSTAVKKLHRDSAVTALGAVLDTSGSDQTVVALDLENLAHTLISDFSMYFSPRYDRNCFRILYFGIFILFVVCVCVCCSFGASDVILMVTSIWAMSWHKCRRKNGESA